MERIRVLLLPAAVALLVATHLIPSEAVAQEGTHAVLCMAWCVLLVIWGAVAAFLPEGRVIFSWSDAALLALVGLHTLSGLIPRDGIVTRHTLNVVWIWVSYGIGALLLRQLLATEVQTRSLLAVMIALAICLTAHANYQYFVGMPRVRAEFHAHPETMLRQEGIPLEADSAARQHFVNRLEAREPLATFALTNSLAGFLAPWTVLTAGLALVLWQAGRQQGLPVSALLILVAILLLGCLLLTKSRTGLLAAICGSVLLAIFGRVGGWRLDWRLPVVFGGVLVLLGLVAVAVGGLDAKVLSEAPKSVLYRLEYWQSAAAMIGDYPLWGCGPGNFQDYYTRYKLPQASETIADPHNLFLEVWATAGTTVLAALVGWMIALAAELGWGANSAAEKKTNQPADPPTSEREIRRIYFGGLAGIALGFALAFLTEYKLWTPASGGHIGIGLMGLPLAALFLWRIHPWVLGGPLPVSLPAIGLVTLLVNLLAAGAVSFPGVVSSALVLFAGARFVAQPDGAGWSIPRTYRPALIVIPLIIGVGCFWAEYSPVLRHQGLMHEAEQLLTDARRRPGDVDLAIERYRAAADADPASSDPWLPLAAIHLQRWLATGDETSWGQFMSAADEWQRLRPASHRQYAQRGAWFLQAYRKSNLREHLDSAQRAYERAVDRYPASALAHAQLAWLHHLAGRREQMQAESARALELDALNPHEELKLRSSHLVDPVPEDDAAETWRIERPETAEQTLADLRKERVMAP